MRATRRVSKKLKERIERGVPAAKIKLRACESELADLDRWRQEAEAELLSAPERLQLGPVSLYAQALVLPVPQEEATRRRDVQAERIAMELARQREEAEGSIVEDTSAPYQVPDPFSRSLARQTGAVSIKASDVIAASVASCE